MVDDAAIRCFDGDLYEGRVALTSPFRVVTVRIDFRFVVVDNDVGGGDTAGGLILSSSTMSLEAASASIEAVNSRSFKSNDVVLSLLLLDSKILLFISIGVDT